MHIADASQIPSGIFAFVLRATRPAMLTEGATDEERMAAGRHWIYSQNLLREGTIIFAGRSLVRTPESFAICCIRAPSLEAAQAIADADPCVIAGVFKAEVFPYQPMLMGDWPAESAEIPV